MPNRDGTQTRVALRPADTKLQAWFAKSVVVILGHGDHHRPVAAVAGGAVVGVLPADLGGFANIASVPSQGILPRLSGYIAPGLRVFPGYTGPATPTLHSPTPSDRVRVSAAAATTPLRIIGIMGIVLNSNSAG